MISQKKKKIKKKELEKERDKIKNDPDSRSCCNPGYLERILKYYDDQIEKLDDDFEKKKKKKIDDDMKKKSPDKHKKLQEKKLKLEETEKKLEEQKKKKKKSEKSSSPKSPQSSLPGGSGSGGAQSSIQALMGNIEDCMKICKRGLLLQNLRKAIVAREGLRDRTTSGTGGYKDQDTDIREKARDREEADKARKRAEDEAREAEEAGEDDSDSVMDELLPPSMFPEARDREEADKARKRAEDEAREAREAREAAEAARAEIDKAVKRALGDPVYRKFLQQYGTPAIKAALDKALKNRARALVPEPPADGIVDEPDPKKTLEALRRMRERYQALYPPSSRKTPDFQPSEDGVRVRARQEMEERLREAELTRPRTAVGANPCVGRAASVPAPQPCSRGMKHADPPASVEVNPCASVTTPVPQPCQSPITTQPGEGQMQRVDPPTLILPTSPQR